MDIYVVVGKFRLYYEEEYETEVLSAFETREGAEVEVARLNAEKNDYYASAWYRVVHTTLHAE